MSNSQNIERLSAIASQRPFFLGYILSRFAERERLADADMASRLGCTLGSYYSLQLCRAPIVGGSRFAEELRQISHRHIVDLATLARIVKEVQVIEEMSATRLGPEVGWLMAARDREQVEGDDD